MKIYCASQYIPYEGSFGDTYFIQEEDANAYVQRMNDNLPPWEHDLWEVEEVKLHEGPYNDN